MKRYLYFAVFVSGMTTLAIEFSASRLLGNVFGNSNVVWASIIGLILIYLTAGYFIGGRWADRSPYPATLYAILAWGAFLAGVVPLVSGPVLRLAADAFDELSLGLLLGSFTAVLALLSAPVTLLGCISPFAIRLAIGDPQQAGRTAGMIYAISTLGSFIGTFLPTLLLIPLVGVARTFLIFSGCLLFVALGGLWLAGGWRAALRLAWMPVVLVFLALLLGRGGIKQSNGQIYETESAYNYIQVLEQGEYRMLRLNEGQGVHSMYHPTQLVFNGPWEQFLAAPFFNPPDYAPENVQRIAIIGLAAGTTARQATAVFGPLPIDGFEIDPKIIEVGRKYFDMNEPNLNAIARDGRWGLEHSGQLYTLVAVDAYRPPYIPPHLTTVEFFSMVREHLTDDGAVVINVGRSPSDRRLIDDLAATLGVVYPSVYVMDVPETFNSIIYATRQPTSIDNLYQNWLFLKSRGNTHPLLLHAIEVMIASQQPTPQGGEVYTDDRSPIEWVTNSMVLNYVFLGGVDDLR